MKTGPLENHVLSTRAFPNQNMTKPPSLLVFMRLLLLYVWIQLNFNSLLIFQIRITKIPKHKITSDSTQS